MCCDSTHSDGYAFTYPDRPLEDWERCRCSGLPSGNIENCRCMQRATGEDGRCDRCRENCITWNNEGPTSVPVALVPFREEASRDVRRRTG